MNRVGAVLLMIGAGWALLSGLVLLFFNGFADQEGDKPVDTVPGVIVLFVIAAACAGGAFRLWRESGD